MRDHLADFFRFVFAGPRGIIRFWFPDLGEYDEHEGHEERA